MKKTIVVIAAIALVFLFGSCGSKNANGASSDSNLVPVTEPAENTLSVFVTVSSAGDIVLADAKVLVKDLNDDGAFDIDEAIACAHDQYSDSTHDYCTENGAYGLCITKLWGVENGGSYGYYVNNYSAMNLNDKVAENDYIVVYSFADLETWSDMYSWFDLLETSETKISLKLTAAGFDSDWNPIDLPVENARITIDGTDSGVVTNVEGRSEIILSDNSEHVISAVCDDLTLVPPVYIVNAK